MSEPTVLTSPRFRDSQRLQRAANNNPPLRRGEQGEAVKLLQQALLDRSYPLPESTRHNGTPDGIYGRETALAVSQFQESYGLRADGSAGRDTLSLLDRIFADPIHSQYIQVPGCPGIAAPKTTSLVEYIHLVRCVAMSRGLSTRETLALLRQATFDSTDDKKLDPRFWNDVLLTVHFDNYAELVADPAVATLSISDYVEDTLKGQERTISMFHLLAGLEAMCAPRSELELGPGPNKPYLLSARSEEVASYLHYLALITLDKILIDMRTNQTSSWDPYFDSPPLEGAIDSYAIRHGLSGIHCDETPGVWIERLLDRPGITLEKVLNDYYIPKIDHWFKVWEMRYSCFIQAISGHMSKGKIQNRKDLVQHLGKKILLCARILAAGGYVRSLTGITPSETIRLFGYLHEDTQDPGGVIVDGYARDLADFVIKWLEAKKHQTEDAIHIDLRSRNSPSVRAFGSAQKDPSGTTILEAVVTGAPKNAFYLWETEDIDNPKVMFEKPNELRTKTIALLPGNCNISFTVLNPGDGRIIKITKTRLNVPQFIVINELITPKEGLWGSFPDLLTFFCLNDNRDALIREICETVNQVLKDVNVRIIWNIPPLNKISLPPQFGPRGYAENQYTDVLLIGKRPENKEPKNKDDESKYNLGGTTTPNGRDIPNEHISIWPENLTYLGYKFGQLSQQLFDTIRLNLSTDLRTKSLWILTVGRITGNIIAHEIAHSLLGHTFGDPRESHSSDDGDILRPGGQITWDQITAIFIEKGKDGLFPAEGTYYYDPLEHSRLVFKGITRKNVESWFPVNPPEQ